MPWTASESLGSAWQSSRSYRRPRNRRKLESQTVHKGTQSQKRKLRQALLQSQRKTDGKELSTLIVQTEIRPADLKWQFLLYQKNNRTHHTDSLCKNGGEGCSGSIQMESGNEDQITTILTIQATRTKSSGDLLSPRPRKIAAIRL